MKKKLYKLLLILLCCRLQAVAQTAGFKYEAAIQPVDSSGFYNIVLTPALNAHLKTDYSDLRIVDDSGKWVPHLVRLVDDTYCSLPKAIELEIVQLTNTGDYTDIIIRGTGRELNEFSVVLKNTVAERYCTLTGSDDMKSWFIINDSIHIKALESEDADNRNFKLEFPSVNYKYYKVQIMNRKRPPLNIQSVVTLSDVVPNEEALLYGTTVDNPMSQILQKDSGSNSYIKVIQGDAFHFDGISLKTSGTKYYKRNAELYVPTSHTHSFSSPGKLIRRFVISNNSTLEYRFPLTNARFFYIVIYNEDNPPLKIVQAKTFMNLQVVTAYLEKQVNYKLLADNKSAATPNYDLDIDEINTKKAVPLATTGKMTLIEKDAIAIQKSGGNNHLIWLAISIAAIILGFFTYRLVTDMNRSKA